MEGCYCWTWSSCDFLAFIFLYSGQLKMFGDGLAIMECGIFVLVLGVGSVVNTSTCYERFD